MILALLVETWWIASVVLRWGFVVFLATAVGAAVVVPNLPVLLGALSLAILCRVGFVGACHFIIETVERCCDD